jgi:hypothetical protein
MQRLLQHLLQHLRETRLRQSNEGWLRTAQYERVHDLVRMYALKHAELKARMRVGAELEACIDG